MNSGPVMLCGEKEEICRKTREELERIKSMPLNSDLVEAIGRYRKTILSEAIQIIIDHEKGDPDCQHIHACLIRRIYGKQENS